MPPESPKCLEFRSWQRSPIYDLVVQSRHLLERVKDESLWV
jgi:hypothetical protein